MDGGNKMEKSHNGKKNQKRKQHWLISYKRQLPNPLHGPYAQCSFA